MKTTKTKFIFAFLIFFIFISFFMNSLFNVSNSTQTSSKETKEPNDLKKVLGVEIRQQNKNGVKFLIVADTLLESKSELNKIILENSFTTINEEGNLTKIRAGHAIITNNYENFNFSDKVVITKKRRKFRLITQTLNGTFEEGNYFTNDKVDIVSGNTIIKGKGLSVISNGEYIKIKGKAILEMLLLKTDDS